MIPHAFAFTPPARHCHLFSDPLLTRGRGGVRLMPGAEALRGPLKTLLAVVAGAMHRRLSQTAPPRL
ncbi:hypothetical protein ATER59S_02756 [Aquamicrobium terrae]